MAFRPSSAGRFSVALWAALPSAVLAAVGIAREWRRGRATLWHDRETETASESILSETGSPRRNRSRRAGWFTVQSGDFTRGFAAAVVLFGGLFAAMRNFVPAGSVGQGWLARFYLHLGEPEALRAHVKLIVAVLIVIAASEEIVWRGWVAALLAESPWPGPRGAWVVAAVLRAVAQLPTMWLLTDPVAGLNPLLVFAVGATSLVWGAMAHVFGRLLPTFFSHVLFLWTVLIMFRFWGPSL